MKRTLIRSSAFVRAAKRLVKKRPDVAEDLRAALELLAEDALHPKLKTHKLKGDLEGSWAARSLSRNLTSRQNRLPCGPNLIGFIRAGSYESHILSFLIGAEILPSQNRMNGATIPGKHCVTQQPPSAGYDLRIAFEMVDHKGSEAILLQTVGTHDEVY